MIYNEFKTFVYNGKKSSEIGVVIAKRPTCYVAQPDIVPETIAGRSGDIIVNNNRFKNIEITIKVRAMPKFCNLSLQQFKNKLSEWLVSQDVAEYKKLKLSYYPNYYRKAVVTNIAEVVAVYKNIYETEITFLCDPFLYSEDGLKEKNIISGEIINYTYTIYNPEKWESEPIMTVNGNGTFAISINGETMTITLNSTAVVIDKQQENVYYKSTGISCNSLLIADKIPNLKPGANDIAITSSVTANFSMSLIPNWRRL